ncbi:hypothetical protein AKJ43_03075 [candidate division MSBL1 archaeon SCGC-AAA261D19]|uniref:Uncharacterized protein n=1 Tax=candidate division MSBL1 archaeon SCGC-AAA261D19 TaxID=1698273 RepID=A0A133V5X0_9EURY|nr:hypothetical protein AKJ43_03075 [candidate division MSBL1 archaeon SCGC-AAA261D19]
MPGAGNMDEGIKLPRKWGLIRCGGRNRNKNPKCSQLLIVKRGQKSKKCPNCGTQRSLEGRRREVLAWSDSQGRIRRAMGELKGSTSKVFRKLFILRIHFFTVKTLKNTLFHILGKRKNKIPQYSIIQSPIINFFNIYLLHIQEKQI